MKQLLKTTLLAATIAAACGSAVAGTVNTAKSTYSTEGLSTLASTATVNTADLTYTLGANYIAGDKMVITVTDGALATGFSFPLAVTGTSGTDTITFGRINTTANSAKYRVDSITSGMTPNGVQLNFGALTLNANAVAAGAVSVEFVSTEFGGSATDYIDGGANNTKVLADTASQLTAIAVATGAGLDATIDVKQERKAFLSGTNDTVAFTIGDNMALTNAATWTSSTVKMTVKGGDSMTFGSMNGGTAAFDKDNSLLTVSYTGGVTNDTITVTPATGANAVALEPQTFNVAANYVFGSGSTAQDFSLGNAAAGQWVLNGAMVNIPYMPYSPTATQIMYISNAGTQAGDIVVTAFDDAGNTWSLGTVGTAAGNTVTKIGEKIRVALNDAGFSMKGKLSITVTVNAPAEDITVYASYNAGSVRGYVNPSEYKGK